MTKTLVAFDTDKIKQYVFSTSSLKEIRGASAILDRLNRHDMPLIVGGNKIYANGGSGLFLVESDTASSVISAVERMYRTMTHGATITGAVIEIPADTGNLQSELALLRHRLRANKAHKSVSTMPVTHPFFRFCSVCGLQYAETEASGDSLCRSCQNKRSEDSRVKREIEEWTHGAEPDSSRLWGRLVKDLETHGYPITGHSRPEDFNDLGNVSSPSGYMGLIYADGDSMGSEIERITNIDDLRRFSEAVDKSVYDAVAETIATHLQPRHGSTLPFDILLLGGDDLVMVTAADCAIEAATHIVERFTQLTSARWGRPLTLSASVTISHVNYPIGSLIHLAESGLKFAKSEAARQHLQGKVIDAGLVNFLVVSSSNHLDFSQYYKDSLRFEDRNETLVRTCRPYTVQDMRQLLKHIRNARNIPRGKLEQLRAAVFKSRRQGNLDAMMTVLRLRNKEQREQLLSLGGNSLAEQMHLPWVYDGNQWVTRVLDVVELLDFVH